MTDLEFASKVHELPPELRQEMLNSLANVLTEEEMLATVNFLTLWDWFLDQDKYKLMRSEGGLLQHGGRTKESHPVKGGFSIPLFVRILTEI